jgi:hypothetical protein
MADPLYLMPGGVIEFPFAGRRSSRQVRHTRRCRARFTTLETRAQHSQRGLSVSSTQTRASRSKPMPPERVWTRSGRAPQAGVA